MRPGPQIRPNNQKGVRDLAQRSKILYSSNSNIITPRTNRPDTIWQATNARILESENNIANSLRISTSHKPRIITRYEPTVVTPGMYQRTGMAATAAALFAFVLSSCGYQQLATTSVDDHGVPLTTDSAGILRPPVEYQPDQVLRRASDITALTKQDGIARPLLEREALVLFYGLDCGKDKDLNSVSQKAQLRAKGTLSPITSDSRLSVALEARAGIAAGTVDSDMGFSVSGLELLAQFMTNLGKGNSFYIDAGILGELSKYDSRIGVERSQVLAPYIELGAGRKDLWRAGLRGFNTDISNINSEFEHLAVSGDHPVNALGVYYDQRLGRVWLALDYSYFEGKWPGLIDNFAQQAIAGDLVIPFGSYGKYNKAIGYLTIGGQGVRSTDLSGGYESDGNVRLGLTSTKGRVIFSLSASSDLDSKHSGAIMFGFGSPLRFYLVNP